VRQLARDDARELAPVVERDLPVHRAAKALAQQANFLKDQGRLTSVAPDYSKNVSVEWVTRAMK